MQRSIFDIQAEFCKAKGNATRLQIIHVLREGPMTVTKLTRVLERSQSLVSRQLSVLRSVGVVSADRYGVEMHYQMTTKKIGEVCDLVPEVLIEQYQKQAWALKDG